MLWMEVRSWFTHHLLFAASGRNQFLIGSAGTSYLGMMYLGMMTPAVKKKTPSKLMQRKLFMVPTLNGWFCSKQEL